MELTCPKCHGTMRTYERNGVHVDQCTECRGIFLDRGELERLVDAETAFHRPAAPVGVPGYGSPADDRYPEDRYRDDRHRDDRYKDDRYKDDRYRSRDSYDDPRRKKKRSFLEDLFD